MGGGGGGGGALVCLDRDTNLPKIKLQLMVAKGLIAAETKNPLSKTKNPQEMREGHLVFLHEHVAHPAGARLEFGIS